MAVMVGKSVRDMVGGGSASVMRGVTAALSVSLTLPDLTSLHFRP
jgi:hypothetical protein